MKGLEAIWHGGVYRTEIDIFMKKGILGKIKYNRQNFENFVTQIMMSEFRGSSH